MNEFPLEEDFHKENEIESNLPSHWSSYDSEDFEESFKEIKLYNHNISLEENFEKSKNPKYVLIEVNQHGCMSVDDDIINTVLSPNDKIVANIDDFHRYTFEKCLVDYDSIFGVRLLTFMKYDSNFMSCDERVFFEALIIKYKKSDFTTFYWSKERIFTELGIKKDRAEKIITRFKELGIISVEKKTRSFEGKPQQVNYFFLHPEKIIELLPKIFGEEDEEDFIFPGHRDIKKYLRPGLEKKKGKKGK
ncbi:hypothetical protein [Chryseobacterium sp.]|uniref:hypothetical protein n=1 Tax=Chryseobacterium sp. TaxID=1871047 RepID=UPI002FC85548